jgi:hypothetical protein
VCFCESIQLRRGRLDCVALELELELELELGLIQIQMAQKPMLRAYISVRVCVASSQNVKGAE